MAETYHERERLLRILSAATFLVFFQAYMVAPLIPRLAGMFGVSEERIGLIVPAYMLPYGVTTLFLGVLADRIGRKRVLIFSLAAFSLLTALTATAQSETQLIGWRLATGLGASGIVPLALSLIGQLFPYDSAGPATWLAVWSNGRRDGIWLYARCNRCAFHRMARIVSGRIFPWGSYSHSDSFLSQFS